MWKMIWILIVGAMLSPMALLKAQNVEFVGSYETSGYAQGIFISDTHAFVADGPSGLKIIDIGDPSNPNLIGSYDTQPWTYNVFISGPYAFLANDYSGLQILNISVPDTPSYSGSYDTDGPAIAVFIS